MIQLICSPFKIALISSTTAMLLLSSCNKSEGGGSGNKNPLTPLDQTSKATITRVLSKLGNVSHIGLDKVSAQKSTNRFGLLISTLDQSLNVPPQSKPDLDRNAVSLNKMKQMVEDPNQCQTTITAPPSQQNGASISIPQFSITITGAKCPIEMSMSIQAQTQQDQGITDATFAFNFKVNDPDFLKESDIDQMSMQGKIYIKADVPKQNETKPMNTDFSASIQGQGHSQADGSFSISDKSAGMMSMTMPSSVTPPNDNNSPNPNQPPQAPNMNFSFQLTDELSVDVKGIQGVLRTLIKQNEKEQVEQYFLNNQSVTKEEAQEFLKNLDFIKPESSEQHNSPNNPNEPSYPNNPNQPQPVPEPTPHPTPQVNLNCTASIYSTRVISTEALAKKVSRSEMVTVPAERVFSSCSMNQNFEAQLTNDKVQLIFNFFEEFVQLSSAVQTNRGTNGVASLTLKNDREDNQVKALSSDYSIWLHCTPVPTCQ